MHLICSFIGSCNHAFLDAQPFVRWQSTQISMHKVQRFGGLHGSGCVDWYVCPSTWWIFVNQLNFNGWFFCALSDYHVLFFGKESWKQASSFSFWKSHHQQQEAWLWYQKLMSWTNTNLLQSNWIIDIGLESLCRDLRTVDKRIPQDPKWKRALSESQLSPGSSFEVQGFFAVVFVYPGGWKQ